MIERRRIVRKQVKIPMKISILEEGLKGEASFELEGDISNITINGVGLEVKIRSFELWEKLRDFIPSSGKIFLLYLELFTPEKKIAAYGNAVWCSVTNLKKKELRIGMFLNKMDAKSRKEWYQFVENL